MRIEIALNLSAVDSLLLLCRKSEAPRWVRKSKLSITGPIKPQKHSQKGGHLIWLRETFDLRAQFAKTEINRNNMPLNIERARSQNEMA